MLTSWDLISHVILSRAHTRPSCIVQHRNIHAIIVMFLQWEKAWDNAEWFLWGFLGNQMHSLGRNDPDNTLISSGPNPRLLRWSQSWLVPLHRAHTKVHRVGGLPSWVLSPHLVLIVLGECSLVVLPQMQPFHLGQHALNLERAREGSGLGRVSTLFLLRDSTTSEFWSEKLWSLAQSSMASPGCTVAWRAEEETTSLTHYWVSKPVELHHTMCLLLSAVGQGC